MLLYNHIKVTPMKKFKTFSVKVEESVLERVDKWIEGKGMFRNRFINEAIEEKLGNTLKVIDGKEVTPKSKTKMVIDLTTKEDDGIRMIVDSKMTGFQKLVQLNKVARGEVEEFSEGYAHGMDMEVENLSMGDVGLQESVLSCFRDRYNF